MCGSAGESMLIFAKCCENVVVIGSNSAGYQLSGNVYNINLPNAGIPNALTSSLCFQYNSENVDGKGYVPDVWCNPKDSLNNVFKTLYNQNMVSNETINKINAEIKKSSRVITLKCGKNTIKPGNGFGNNLSTKAIYKL